MTFKVGLRRLFYEDAGRLSWDAISPRPLLTDVWYPALSTAIEDDIFMGPPNMPFFHARRACRDAALASIPAQFPLILLSYGTGGLSLQLGC
jgi:hypothetical protein